MALRRLIRDLTSYLAILLVVAALGGYTWLTHNPEAPVLEAAQEWPVVGGLAQRMRRAYLGEPPAPAGEPIPADEADGEPLRLAQAAPGVSGPIHPPVRHGAEAAAAARSAAHEAARAEEREELAAVDPDGLPALFGPTAKVDLGRIVRPTDSAARPTSRGIAPPPSARHLALEWRWFLPGQPVRGARGAASGGRELPALAYLPILAREGGWSQVLYQGEPGWVEDGWGPAHSRRSARQGGIRRHVQPPRVASFDRLHSARKILGQKRTERSLGAYQLWTDVADEELLGFLDGLAAVAEDAYFARFARLPSGDPLRSAVLFADEAAYREYSGDDILLSNHAGHAGGGVLASYTAGRPRAEVASTLVHEITHLVNARALAWELPPWLQEGMAGELDAVWVEASGVDSADGRTVAASFVGFDEHDRRVVQLGQLLASGGLPPLHQIILLDREEFYQGDASTHYAYSGALVRYLLDGDGRRYRAGFLRFLQRVANGYTPNGALFLDAYETKDTAFLVALDRGFRSWIAAEQPAARQRIQTLYASR